MTILFYASRREREFFIKRENQEMLHDDFIDINDNPTDGNSGRLTFENTIEPIDPNDILFKLLLGKLKNDTITISQLKMLIRLEHGFELTQTTRDKILVAVQGMIGTLRDRLKAAFNL